MPLQSYDVTAEEVLSINPDRPSLNFTHNELREEDTRGGEVRLSNHSAGSVTSLYKYSTEMLTEEQSHDQLQQEKFEDKGDKEDVWKIITPTPMPLVAMLVHRAADVAGRVFSHSDVEEEQGPPAPSGYRKSQN